MELYEQLDILGRAFSRGEIDALAEVLDENCNYRSDYSHRSLTSAGDIIDNMRDVYEAVNEQSEAGADCTYSYTVVDLNSILKDGIKLYELSGPSIFKVSEKGILLFQYGAEEPVAVVFIKMNPGGYIKEINLSRSHIWFDLNFYGEDGQEDMEEDIPYTVKPMSSHERQRKELQDLWTYQRHEHEELGDSRVYIWRKADVYFRGWLENNGYYLIESQIYDDCIGYRCNRRNYVYTIYMFAYGQNKTVWLDGDYCAKLLDNKLSANSTALVVGLHVNRFKRGDKIRFSVGNYFDDDQAIQLWRINAVKGKMILEYYPCKEIMDITYRLMYAFNRDNRDVYDCIICADNPAFSGVKSKVVFLNEAFYTNLFRLHKEYGDMKLGYVSFNDVVYSKVPYIEDYGYFTFQADNRADKILSITASPFEGGEHNVTEFIKTDEREDDEWYSDVPCAVEVKALAPVPTERFALKLSFDNGECKKYVLPIDQHMEKDEVINFDHHVFTDKIWSTARLEKSSEAHRGMAVCFMNEYAVSVMKCYEEATAYTEPEPCNELVYEDEECLIEKCWQWKVKSFHEDKETGLLETLILGEAINYHGISTFASKNGKRLNSIDFDYIDSFREGLALVGKSKCGYGFIDRNMHFVIPMIYENAESFKKGVARVKRHGKWLHVDKNGREIEICSPSLDSGYQDVGEFNEGMCKVSTLKLRSMDLAFYSDYSEIAGTWGFINESGEEVIKPQYIYAEDFHSGVAVVCKGKWTIDKKWDNEYNTGRYWTEEELWGAIDKSGNEVVPFIFDEIKHFWDIDDVLAVHYGGWKNGHWGVIDNHGKWLAEPIFEKLDYEYYDGLFAFYKEANENDDVPLGIYDIKQKKVIFEPQFFSVSFRGDGWIQVEVYDEELGRRIEKLIDRNGKEKFYSVYTSIYAWGKRYEVLIEDENGNHHGLIDEDGNVIVPCNNSIPWKGIHYEQGLIIFQQGDKQGIMDLAGNIIIEPKYNEIYCVDEPMYIVRIGEGENYREGMISRNGRDVIPADYECISWMRDNYFACRKNGLCEMYRLMYKA